MKMKSFKIPQQYQFGITLIIKIDEPLFNRLLSAITEVHPFVDIDSLVLEISPKIEEVSINDLQEILKAIHSIYSVRIQGNLKNTEIITGLINAVSSDDTFSQLSAEELAHFKQRLTKILAIDGSISISSQSLILLQEYDSIFLNSRIITDVRPVFKAETKEEIAGALVVHTLKIAYQDASGSKEFYVALDSSDVKKLQEQLSQSLIEAKVIQAMLNKADVVYLDPNSSSK
ncbi:hypothetical protein FJR41_000035 [Dolichospermum planctonicum UHCC 0167]|jgi:hypothetical protein|uniref:hypothetical protein n=1 Tax=Dolichospermum planctonicum TaxID=136072 RepID=UPI002245091D|nr:hypothetical protein [Dolichospermum planctonicum]MCW9679221.1 hypothetical protein [Dolichospermum planctonicum UHCC 0167]